MYILENEDIKIKVQSKGAELTSVQVKPYMQERIWQKDAAIWNRYAPLLFPYCGRIKKGTIQVNGESYPATAHGFARDMEFTLLEKDDTSITLQLEANEETKKSYPFLFRLLVKFTLEKNKLTQSVTVINIDELSQELPFGVGFHPAFRLPFGQGKAASDFELVFEKQESPFVVETLDGFVSGKQELLFENQNIIQLEEDMFAQDSICLTGLTSSWVKLRDKVSGAAVQVGLQGFPYVLLWSAGKTKLPFVCIEPWHSLPDPVKEYGEFTNKPTLMHLKAEENFTALLEMVFTN